MRQKNRTTDFLRLEGLCKNLISFFNSLAHELRETNKHRNQYIYEKNIV